LHCVIRYVPKRNRPPSATWAAFLQNQGLIACDFFTVPALTFGILYVFVIIRHFDRRLVSMRVTSNPTARWTSDQILNAFPFDEAPKYLLHDNDSIYGCEFMRMLNAMDIREVHTAKSSPWQNPYAERVIGSIRRECTNHIVPWNGRHLQRTLNSCRTYYNDSGVDSLPGYGSR
jgi:hypothetical protein